MGRPKGRPNLSPEPLAANDSGVKGKVSWTIKKLMKMDADFCAAIASAHPERMVAAPVVIEPAPSQKPDPDPPALTHDRAFAQRISCLEREAIERETNKVTIAVVQAIIADFYGLSMAELLSRRNTMNLAGPRHVAYALCRELTTASFLLIGAKFASRDHTTIISGARRHKQRMATDPKLASDYAEIKRRIVEHVFGKNCGFAA